MPYTIRKANGYSVTGPHGTKAKHTTKKKAERQVRLLNAVDHGWKPTGEPASEALVDVEDLLAGRLSLDDVL